MPETKVLKGIARSACTLTLVVCAVFALSVPAKAADPFGGHPLTEWQFQLMSKTEQDQYITEIRAFYAAAEKEQLLRGIELASQSDSAFREWLARWTEALDPGSDALAQNTAPAPTTTPADSECICGGLPGKVIIQGAKKFCQCQRCPPDNKRIKCSPFYGGTPSAPVCIDQWSRGDVAGACAKQAKSPVMYSNDVAQQFEKDRSRLCSTDHLKSLGSLGASQKETCAKLAQQERAFQRNHTSTAQIKESKKTVNHCIFEGPPRRAGYANTCMAKIKCSDGNSGFALCSIDHCKKNDAEGCANDHTVEFKDKTDEARLRQLYDHSVGAVIPFDSNSGNSQQSGDDGHPAGKAD